MKNVFSFIIFFLAIKGRVLRFVLPEVPEVMHPPIPDDGKFNL